MWRGEGILCFLKCFVILLHPLAFVALLQQHVQRVEYGRQIRQKFAIVIQWAQIRWSSCTFVGTGAFAMDLTFSVEVCRPSVSTRWPKRSTDSCMKLHFTLLSLKPFFSKRCRSSASVTGLLILWLGCHQCNEINDIGNALQNCVHHTLLVQTKTLKASSGLRPRCELMVAYLVDSSSRSWHEQLLVVLWYVHFHEFLASS